MGFDALSAACCNQLTVNGGDSFQLCIQRAPWACWWLQIHRDGNIYTTENDQSYKPDIFFPFFKDSWLLNIYYQHSTGFKKGVWEQSWGYQVLKQKELIVLEMGNVRGKGFRKWGSRANTTTYFTISLEFGNAPPQTIGHPHPTLTWHIHSCILTFNLKFLINHHQRCS